MTESTAATWTAKPQAVERIVAAVLPHTAADGYVPVITCVRVEITDGRFLAVATDRYTLGVAWSDLTAWDEEAATDQSGAACIFASDWRRLFAFLRPHRKEVATWVLTDESLNVTVKGESLSVRTVDVNFVTWRRLIGNLTEKSATGSGTPVMRFKPVLVGHFLQTAKALGEDTSTMVWNFGSEHTDAPLIRIGDNFIGLLMPQRMPDGPPAIDLSPLGIESAKAVAA